MKTPLQIISTYPLTIFITVLASALFILSGPVPEAMIFNQVEIIHGEVWRMISAHLVHSDRAHFIWNMSAFILLSLLLEQHGRKHLLLSLFCGITMIDLYLWNNTIGVINYAGLSGVLNTLLVSVLFQQWQINASDPLLRKILLSVYLASFGKIIIEIAYQQSLFTQISWQPLPQAHLAGFFAGTVISLLALMFNRTGLKEITLPG